MEVKGLTKSFTFVVAAGSASSGAAAFLYLVVWMRRVALTFGDTSFVTATAISAFLGGMALGAWIWGRLGDRRPRSSLMIFAGLELATGVYGVASSWILHGVEALYLFVYPPFADHGIFLASAQFILIVLFIFPGAVLMGGLPPLLARRGLSNESGTVGMAGAVYGWSALGAAFGGVMTIYGLLPRVGLRSTVLLAAAINVLVSAAAFWTEMRSRRRSEPLNVKGSMPISGWAGESSAQFMKFLVSASVRDRGICRGDFPGRLGPADRYGDRSFHICVQRLDGGCPHGYRYWEHSLRPHAQGRRRTPAMACRTGVSACIDDGSRNDLLSTYPILIRPILSIISKLLWATDFGAICGHGNRDAAACALLRRDFPGRSRQHWNRRNSPWRHDRRRIYRGRDWRDRGRLAGRVRLPAQYRLASHDESWGARGGRRGRRGMVAQPRA